MVKTKKDSHPALRWKDERGKLEREVEGLARGGGKGLVGWEGFIPREKQFLLALPYLGSIASTEKYIGVPDNWCAKRRKAKEDFDRAVVTVRARGTLLETGRQAIFDLYGKTLAVLDEVLTAEKDGSYRAPWTVRMDAVKHVHKVMGLLEEKEGTQTNTITAQQVVVGQRVTTGGE